MNRTFNGNLTITLNDALTITIPRDQLLFDEPFIPSNGIVTRNTDWKNIPIVRYDDTDQEMPKIGGMFFSSACLMVNHDKNEFTIAGVQEERAAQQLMGIDTTNDCVASVDTGSSTAIGPSTQSKPPSGSSKGLAGGTVAGIVVGILALLAALTAIAILARRRRRASNDAPNNGELAAAFGNGAIAENDGAPILEKFGYSVSELQAGQIQSDGPAVSLQAQPLHDVAELDGMGRPAEIPVHTMDMEDQMRGHRRFSFED